MIPPFLIMEKQERVYRVTFHDSSQVCEVRMAGPDERYKDNAEYLHFFEGVQWGKAAQEALAWAGRWGDYELRTRAAAGLVELEEIRRLR